MNKRVKKDGMLEEWKKKETLQEENALASHACRTKESQKKRFTTATARLLFSKRRKSPL
jgi:hypothetical protein